MPASCAIGLDPSPGGCLVTEGHDGARAVNPVRGVHRLAVLTAAATFLLLFVGGLVTSTVGSFLGSAAPPAFLPLGRLLVGTALAAAGTLALNQWMERDLDARMARTRHRPLPEGRLLPAEAFALGAALLAAGIAVLA